MSDDFSMWFETQHGMRPGGKLTDQQMLDVMRAGDAMREDFRRRCNWDDRRTSALWAWQAREKP